MTRCSQYTICYIYYVVKPTSNTSYVDKKNMVYFNLLLWGGGWGRNRFCIGISMARLIRITIGIDTVNLRRTPSVRYESQSFCLICDIAVDGVEYCGWLLCALHEKRLQQQVNFYLVGISTGCRFKWWFIMHHSEPQSKEEKFTPFSESCVL